MKTRRRFRIGTLLVADARMTVRNKQHLFFAFLFPVLFMTLLGLAFGGGETFSLPVGIVDRDGSQLSRTLVQDLEKVRGIRVHEGTARDELAALERGERRLVIVVPAGFSYVAAGFESTLEVFEDQTDPENTQIALTVLQSALAEAGAAGSPVSIKRHEVTGKRLRYLDFLTPGIIGMGVQNLGVMGAVATLVVYRERGILRRIRVTPLPLSTFVGAQAGVSLILAVMQLFVIVGIAITVFDVTIVGSLVALAVLALVGNLVFVNLGIIVSSAANTFQTANTLGLLVTLPMVFLSGVFFPTEGMPEFIQPLVGFLPLTHLVDGLREVVLRGGTLASVSRELLILLAWGVGLFVLAVRAFRWE